MTEPDAEKSKTKDPLVGLALVVAIALSLITPGKEIGMVYKIGQALGLWLFAGIVPGLVWVFFKMLRKPSPSRRLYFIHTGIVLLLGGSLAFSGLTQGRTQSRPVEAYSVDDLLQGFPPLSQDAKAAFRQRVADYQLSEEETGALLWQLMAEGETLMSEADKSEMASLYWKAIDTISPEDQMFLAKVNMKVSQGSGYTAADQQKSSALVQQGFSNLPPKENDRYLQIRVKTIELALLKPQDAQQQFKSTYPSPSPSGVNSMTPEQKQQRMQELTAKAISHLPEKDRARFLELQSTSADQLTKAQYAERVKYSEQIKSLLSESEMEEMMELTADMLENQ